MKLQATLVIGAACVATAAAFTAGRPALGARSIAAALPRSSSAQPRSMSTSLRMSEADFVKTEISSANVVVFSKSFCPFCKKTKKLLDGKGVEYKAIELDKMDNGDSIQDALLELSGQRTVPNVFIKGTHLGGNDDTQKANKSGKLDEMIA